LVELLKIIAARSGVPIPRQSAPRARNKVVLYSVLRSCFVE
jgi:hypothetical protein